MKLDLQKRKFALSLYNRRSYGFDGEDFTDAEYVVENKLLEEELGAVVRRIYPI